VDGINQSSIEFIVRERGAITFQGDVSTMLELDFVRTDAISNSDRKSMSDNVVGCAATYVERVCNEASITVGCQWSLLESS